MKVTRYELWKLRHADRILPSSLLSYVLGLRKVSERQRLLIQKRLSQRTRSSSTTLWGLEGEDEANRILTACGYHIEPPPHPTGKYSGIADGLIPHAHGLEKCLWENLSCTKLPRVWCLETRKLVQIQANMYYANIPYTLYSQYHPDGMAVYLIAYSAEFWKRIEHSLDRLTHDIRLGDISCFDSEISDYDTLVTLVRSRLILKIQRGYRWVYYLPNQVVNLESDNSSPSEPVLHDLYRSKYFYTPRKLPDLAKYRYRPKKDGRE